MNIRQFIDNLLIINNSSSIKKSTTINKDIIFQKHKYIPRKIINKLIKKIYNNISNINKPFLR